MTPKLSKDWVEMTDIADASVSSLDTLIYNAGKLEHLAATVGSFPHLRAATEYKGLLVMAQSIVSAFGTPGKNG